MNRFVWILAVLYVVLGAGLFYSLAIESMALFAIAGGLLALFAVPQWYLLSRDTGQPRGPQIPRDRS